MGEIVVHPGNHGNSPVSHDQPLAARLRARALATENCQDEHGDEQSRPLRRACREDYAALARLLLRAGGVASTSIEGVIARVIDIVLAEADDATSSAAAWVVANLAAVTEAVEERVRDR